ncbi:TPA: hypothetical protein R0E75_001938 [Klebsiella michiganensis]|nr:hypothetical protein [Klebsiella michiganensis]
MDTKKLFKHIPWVILGIIGAFCLSVVALRRGEHVSALWIVVASVSVYLVVWGGDRLCMDGSSPRKQREALRDKA